MNKNTTYWGETTRGKTPDLSFVSQRLPESGHLLSLFHLSIPMWRQRRTIWLDPMAQRPRPGRAGLWASLTPLEASKLVHGPLRVDPGGGPRQEKPGAKKLLLFSLRVWSADRCSTVISENSGFCVCVFWKSHHDWLHYVHATYGMFYTFSLSSRGVTWTTTLPFPCVLTRTTRHTTVLPSSREIPSRARQLSHLYYGGGDDGSGAPFHLTSLKSLFPPWAICQICQTALCAAEGRWRGGREFLGCLAIRARKEGEKGGKGQTVCVWARMAQLHVEKANSTSFLMFVGLTFPAINLWSRGNFDCDACFFSNVLYFLIAPDLPHCLRSFFDSFWVGTWSNSGNAGKHERGMTEVSS